MTIKHLTVNDLYRIAVVGGGFRISAKSFTVNDLYRLCAASANHPSQIIIEDSAALSIDDMYRLASAGKGSTFFE